MCDAEKIAKMIAFYDRQRAEYKAELALCQQIIKDKVKGQIRKAQRRANELKENIHTNRAVSEPYRTNGGIW